MDESHEGSGIASHLADLGGGGTANFHLYAEPWPTEQGSEVRTEPF